MGSKVELYRDGKLISVEDTRNLQEEKQTKLAHVRAAFRAHLDGVIPDDVEQKQRFGMTLSAAERAQLTAIFVPARDKRDQLLQQINAATSLDELDAVKW